MKNVLILGVGLLLASAATAQAADLAGQLVKPSAALLQTCGYDATGTSIFRPCPTGTSDRSTGGTPVSLHYKPFTPKGDDCGQEAGNFQDHGFSNASGPSGTQNTGRK